MRMSDSAGEKETSKEDCEMKNIKDEYFTS